MVGEELNGPLIKKSPVWGLFLFGTLCDKVREVVANHVIQFDGHILVCPNNLTKSSPFCLNNMFIHKLCDIGLVFWHSGSGDIAGSHQIKAHADLTWSFDGENHFVAITEQHKIRMSFGDAIDFYAP